MPGYRGERTSFQGKKFWFANVGIGAKVRIFRANWVRLSFVAFDIGTLIFYADFEYDSLSR